MASLVRARTRDNAKSLNICQPLLHISEEYENPTWHHGFWKRLTSYSLDNVDYYSQGNVFDSQGYPRFRLSPDRASSRNNPNKLRVQIYATANYHKQFDVRLIVFFIDLCYVRICTSETRR